MPFISNIQRQTDFNLVDSNTPIVIDNGASYFRIGWAGEPEPRVIFRNIVQRPRHKVTGETVTIVGDHDPALLKYFDCTRSGPRSAFDSNVVYQFETMEYILDFGFDRMGATTEIDHPVLITECVCNPVQSRSKMAELLFETYGVPSIAFGVDVAFSYKYNQQQGVCAKDGLALCPGFNTTHVIPFVDGEPVYEGCCRTNIGGFHVTNHLKQLLSLKYPYHLTRFTWEKVEDLKMEHCYIAPDYASEARLFQKEPEQAEGKTRCWELPWVPPPTDEPPSEEEIARKAAIKEKQGQRLREMAEAKRSSKINELENELHGLEFLLHQLEQVEESEVLPFLSETGYVNRQEIESARNKVIQSLRKAKGEPKNEQAETEKEDLGTSEKYSLINIPDDMLTGEQLNEKKKQLSLKSMADGRQRLKQKGADDAPTWCRETQYISYGGTTNVTTPVCRMQFHVPDVLSPPVLLYYRLTNFYQNHRRYVKSFDMQQLNGEYRSASDIDGSDCDPLQLGEDGKPYYPCGLIANSLFNDTIFPPLALNWPGESGNYTYDMKNTSIAWDSDKELYKTVTTDVYPYGSVVPPMYWREKYPVYNETFPYPDLHTDEAFQVWMRTAGLPTFSKLARRNDTRAMEIGRYQVDVYDYFPVNSYDGTKSILLSTRTIMGGKNPFLGIAYVVVGGLCIVLGALFTATHLIKPRKLGDHSYLSWNTDQPSTATTTGRSGRPGEGA